MTFRTILLSLAILMIGSLSLSAQQLDFNAGVGVIPSFVKDKGKVLLMPIEAGFEFRFQEKFTLGLNAMHSVTEGEKFVGDGGPKRWENTQTVLSLRGGAVATRWKKWEAYGGMNLNIGLSSINFLGDSEKILKERHGMKDNRTTFFMGAQVGTRYLINDYLRVYGELGTGGSLGKLGIQVSL